MIVDSRSGRFSPDTGGRLVCFRRRYSAVTLSSRSARREHLPEVDSRAHVVSRIVARAAASLDETPFREARLCVARDADNAAAMKGEYARHGRRLPAGS